MPSDPRPRPPSRDTRAALLWMVLVGSACAKSNDSAGASSDARTARDAVSDAGGAAEGPMGVFELRLVAEVAVSPDLPATPAHSLFSGRVLSGAPPPLRAWRKTATEGSCELLVPRAPFCDPPCEDGVCTEGDRCVKQPAPRSAGTVRLQGVRSEPANTGIAMEPQMGSFTYTAPAELTLAHPPADPGAKIRLVAEGADVPGFQIEAPGITPLVLQGPETLPVERMQPMRLQWAPAGAAEASTIEVSVDLSHHGGTKGEVHCTAPDSGSLEISASLVTQLIDLGLAGFPKVTVSRQAIGRSDIPASASASAGRAQLIVRSEVMRLISIPGLVSCVSSSDCSQGQTCQQDATCR
jgi:hypothetical protein